MTSQDSESLELSQDEATALIYLTDPASGNVAGMRFGLGRAWLWDTPDNQWAIQALREMRSRTT